MYLNAKPGFQIFAENAWQSVLTVIKVLILSRFNVKIKKPENCLRECVVLGNSPSLTSTVAKNLDFLKQRDLFGVNFFVKTELFTLLKPRYYMIVSMNYWSSGKNDFNEAGRKSAFHEIAELTSWNMMLFVPAEVKNRRDWRTELDKNPNITISYVNITPVEGLQSVNHFFFKHNLGLPRPHNVLIPCIKIAVDLKYEKVYILGAEHSWLKDLFVANDNRVYLTQKHFYDEKEAKPETMYKGTSNDERNLAETLMKFVHTFNSYYVLDEYAVSNNVKILNATPESYIDAFERFKLNS